MISLIIPFVLLLIALALAAGACWWMFSAFKIGIGHIVILALTIALALGFLWQAWLVLMGLTTSIGATVPPTSGATSVPIATVIAQVSETPETAAPDQTPAPVNGCDGPDGNAGGALDFTFTVPADEQSIVQWYYEGEAQQSSVVPGGIYQAKPGVKTGAYNGYLDCPTYIVEQHAKDGNGGSITAWSDGFIRTGDAPARAS